MPAWCSRESGTMEEWGRSVAQTNEDEDGRSVAVGLPTVGCREEERGGGLGDGGVDG